MKKDFIIRMTFEKDIKTGKKKLVDIHFPTETIRQLTDFNFIKNK